MKIEATQEQVDTLFSSEVFKQAEVVIADGLIVKDRQGATGIKATLEVAFTEGVDVSTLGMIRQWGIDRNIIGGATSKDQLPKLMSEIGELADKGIARRNLAEIKDGIGDAIVVLAMIAGIEGLTVEECIEHAYHEIKDRKGVLYNGVFVKDTDLAGYHHAMVALGRWHPDSNIHGIGPDVGGGPNPDYKPDHHPV